LSLGYADELSAWGYTSGHRHFNIDSLSNEVCSNIYDVGIASLNIRQVQKNPSKSIKIDKKR